nr:MAG TPA: capsid scaffolding protein [Caudoviricetes sp.]
MKSRMFRMLQLFAEETVDHTAEPDAVKDSVNPENTSDDSGEEKKYTDKDVDAIVNKRFAKWKTEQEQAVKSAKEEAEKLAKMNAEQKQNYEIEKLQKENEKLKQEAAKVELSRSATGILAEKGIEATQDVLDFVVGNDADDTNAKIDKLVKIVESQLKKAEIARATGSTPKTMTNSGSPMSEFEKRLAKYK